MGESSAIEWTDATFNPWIGCTKVSPGCKNCYAATTDDRRFSRMPSFGAVSHWGPGAPRHVTSDSYWKQPLAWNHQAAKAGQRKRVFCASLADVFDEEAPAGALERLWALIRLTPHLDWQLLTKRPERIAACLPPDWGKGYANVWLGTSVEDQQRADERVPHLLAVPARVRFLSCEPLLGAVRLDRVRHSLLTSALVVGSTSQLYIDSLRGYSDNGDRRRIHWVIAGGESGPGARPMSTKWARSLRDQCVDAGVAFLFKQWGEWLPISQDPRDMMEIPERGVTDFDANDPSQGDDFDTWHMVGKKRAGRLLDGRTWDELPEVVN